MKPVRCSFLVWLAAAMLVSGVAVAPYDVTVASKVASMTAGLPWLNLTAHFVSDWGNYVFYVGFTIALVAGLVKRDRLLIGIGLTYGLTVLLFSGIIGGSIKACLGRPRPFVGDGLAWHHFCFKGAYNSFPSGHTMDAFAAVAPIWQRVRATVMKAATCGLAFVIGVSRVMTHQHYPTDVLAGAGLSLIGGLVISRLLAGHLARWFSSGRMEGEQPNTSGDSPLG
jgi:undecaprenyl-diphosphatase